MDYIEIIITVLQAIFTLACGGVGLWFIKETKALKREEVNDKRVDIELKEADAWKDIADEFKAKSEEKSKTIRTLYANLNEKERTINAKDIMIMRLEFEKEKLLWNECRVNGCPNRQPPRDRTKHTVKNGTTAEKTLQEK